MRVHSLYLKLFKHRECLCLIMITYKYITLFKRTMTIEAYKDAPLPDDLFRIVNPANIDKYHAAIARQLEG